ncbi:hypothetical protein [Parasphingorhabdus sp.]|uniref:hypothetical protein n=1 Tax=Parasphingorhabdus sp. TaxID=2709688 RepID=UPI00300128C5
MKIWNRPSSEEATKPDLNRLAAARISAAARLDAAIVEVEASLEGLLDADRTFFNEVRSSGQSDYGSSGNLLRVIRTLIVGQMQVSAPNLTKHLGLLHVPARAQGPIADAVARTATNDLTNHYLPKETAS